MLQELIRAYADAYTIAITARDTRRHDHVVLDAEPLPEAPAGAKRGRGWRTLLSAFL